MIVFFALQVGIPCTLWVDNALVYRRLQQFRSHPCWVKPNQKDSDLWSTLYKAVQALGSKLVAVAKVFSHQDLSEAGDDVERWAFRGNSAADSLAEDGYDTQPQLMQIWNRLVIQIGQTRTLRAAVHETMVRVGRTAARSQPQLPEETAVVRAPRLTQADVFPVQLVAANAAKMTRWKSCRRTSSLTGANNCWIGHTRTGQWGRGASTCFVVSAQCVARSRLAIPGCRIQHATTTMGAGRWKAACWLCKTYQLTGKVHPCCDGFYWGPGQAGTCQASFWGSSILDTMYPHEVALRSMATSRQPAPRPTSPSLFRQGSQGPCIEFRSKWDRYASACAEASTNQKSGEKWLFSLATCANGNKD